MTFFVNRFPKYLQDSTSSMHAAYLLCRDRPFQKFMHEVLTGTDGRSPKKMLWSLLGICVLLPSFSFLFFFFWSSTHSRDYELGLFARAPPISAAEYSESLFQAIQIRRSAVLNGRSATLCWTGSTSLTWT